VLIVDDDHQMAATLAEGLADRGYDARAVSSAADAFALLAKQPLDAIVTDLRMPGVDGLQLLTQIRQRNPGLPVLVMTAYGAIDSAIEAVRQGASHYLAKPFKLEELAVFLARAIDENSVRREASALRAALGASSAGSELVAVSKAMRDVLEVVDRVANADLPVLILGETGTGKGVVARQIHACSERASGPFVTVNCAALPEPLLESELFGHVRGAFTGATKDRAGLVMESSGGTLFLDEIAEMSPALQAKLLDVLERRVVRAVGASGERDVDLRVIAATHRNLDDRVGSGAFREDLRYRLDVVTIELPPLRRRREDIPHLLDHFLREARARHPSSPAEWISDDATARLLSYRWPGNVRELAHAVQRLVLLARAPEITAADLPQSILVARAQEGPQFGGDVRPVRDITRQYAAWALEQLGGHRGRTAERLGVDAKTLARWLSDLDSGISPDKPERGC
jgi:two-component system response regulator HydG